MATVMPELQVRGQSFSMYSAPTCRSIFPEPAFVTEDLVRSGQLRMKVLLDS